MKAKMGLMVMASVLCMQCSYSQKSNAQKSGMAGNANANPVVIELFTSEGCSSCPSADALMPELKDEYKDKLIVLSFHVDYWDRLGWKDAFSSSEWTRRQNQYASAFGTDNIYTPEAIVDGKTDITGSNRDGLTQLINNNLNSGRQMELQLKADKKDDRNVSVTYSADLKSGEVISIALVQQHATIDVRRGENGGRRLEHYDIVRDFKTMQSGNGNVTFSLPDGLDASKFNIVLLVQKESNMQVFGAKEISL